MIQAEVHSDDWVFQAKFDATAFFAQASAKDIDELIACGWGGDYPADAVAKHFEGETGFEEIDALFDYCRRKDGVGFECNVTAPDQVVEYLKAQRPEIFEAIRSKVDDEDAPRP